MQQDKYLGMRPGDLDGKPYAKFWQPDMSPMPTHVTEALLRGEEARELAFGLGDANELLKPGYLPLENGYARLNNGQFFVAVRTEMPEATGARMPGSPHQSRAASAAQAASRSSWHIVQASGAPVARPRSGRGTRRL